MKKALTSLAMIFLVNTYVHAQEVKDGNIPVKKIDRPAVLANYNFSKDIVTKVLKDKLDKTGLMNRKSQSGFVIYEGIAWQGLTESKMDVYTKVSGNKNQATVYILLSKGYDNFINSTSDPEVYNKAKNFLNNLEKDIEDYQQQLIREQKEKELEKEQKKYDKMMKEKERKEKELQKQNEKLQEKQQALQEVRS